MKCDHLGMNKGQDENRSKISLSSKSDIKQDIINEITYKGLQVTSKLNQ